MKEIQINQSLHGYSEGHRLLESSVKLPDEIARLMLRVSDLSGGSIFPGFDEYLTGYPIAPLNLYVFAKTWYAAEMPRPGCVWTHSLILQCKDLDAIPSFEQLLKFFVRPKSDKTSSKSPQVAGAYAAPIRLAPEFETGRTNPSDAALSNQLNALVASLYALKRRNLLIAAPASAVFEMAILRLWSQQWPTLRANFSFCTGALSGRGFAGKPFDVQCAPPQLIREITTSVLAKQSQEMSLMAREEPMSSECWIDSTIADAALPGGGEFRQLLWAIGDSGRLGDFKSFAGLATRFLSGQTLSLPELIGLVADNFPERDAAINLKSNLFGGNRPAFGQFSFSEWEVLSELSTSSRSTAYDSEKLNLRSRANELCKNSQDDAKQLISKLFREQINELGEDVLAGLIEAMNADIARRLSEHQPHVLPTLFRAKPELGASPELWRAAGEHARELFESLSSTDNLSDQSITAISGAILSSETEFLIRRALDKWGRPAVFGVLDHVAGSGVELSERTMGALTFHTKCVMEWLCSEKERPLFAKVICAHVVGQYSYQIREFGTEVWLRVYEELRLQSNYKELNFVATLLLALGLQNTSPIPVKVVGLCFEHIHQLAWDDKIPDANWIILDPIVPHLMWLHDWDKCERLRRGLAEAFVKFGWPAEQLYECVRSDNLLDRVLASAKKVEGAARYFR